MTLNTKKQFKTAKYVSTNVIKRKDGFVWVIQEQNAPKRWDKFNIKEQDVIMSEMKDEINFLQRQDKKRRERNLANDRKNIVRLSALKRWYALLDEQAHPATDLLGM